MSAPLKNPRHEGFALHIANGHKLERAHELAGFKPDRKSAWALRHRPDIARRVEEILKHRVQADTRRRARREKRDDDLRDQVISELRRIAFADIREIANWKREPVISPDGEVLGLADRIAFTASDKLSTDSAAAIKSVFQKSGQVRIEMHDKQTALLALAKHLKLFDNEGPTSKVVVNQIHLGDVSALDVARRVAFLLSSAGSTAASTMSSSNEKQKVQISP